MAEGTLGTNGDLDGNAETGNENRGENAIPEEEQQNQGDILNGDIVPKASSDAGASSSGPPVSGDINEANSVPDGPPLLDNSDTDSADLTITESSSISKSREEKLRIARESYEQERKRKIAEILEAQRQAEEFRIKQQEDRRRKIEEMRRKDQERRKTVEERRRRMHELEEERRASLLRRSQARESRIDTMRSSRMPSRMAMSCIFGSGEAALNALSRPRVAFGSGTPREICRPIAMEPYPAILLNGSTGRSSSAYHAGCLLSAHARSHRRAASAPSGSRMAARVRRDMRTGYQPPRLASAKATGSPALRASNGFGPPATGQQSANSVANLTPNRGARSASRGGTTDSAARRQPFSMGQTRSASVTPSSSFMAEKPGQVEKALANSSTPNRRAARSTDRHRTANKTPTPPDGNSGDTSSSVKLRSRSQGGERHHVTPGSSNRPRPTSQVVTPAELDSVFARLAQPKRNFSSSDSSKTATSVGSATKDKRSVPSASGPVASNNKKSPANQRTPSARPERAASSPRASAGPVKERRRPPSSPSKLKTGEKEAPDAAAVSPSHTPSPQHAAAEPSNGPGDEVAPKEAVAEPPDRSETSDVITVVTDTAELSKEPPKEAEPAQPETETENEEVDQDEDEDEEELVALEPIPSIMTQSMPAVMVSSSSTKDLTEEEYRLRIAEQRRLAREKMERDRQQKEEERQARAEQERLRREQARQMAEEARRRMEEEEERQRQEEEQARLAEEERLRREEEERKQREEEERQARELAEQERLERMAREEEERQARRARLERIMSRVKRTDDSPTPPAVTVAPAAGEQSDRASPSVVPGKEATTPPGPDSEPAGSETPSPQPQPVVVNSNGRGESPIGVDRDSSTESISPPTRKSSSPAEAPKFKSALLQSMLAGGRLSIGAASEGGVGLRRASGSALSVLQASGVGGSQDAVNSAAKGPAAEPGVGVGPGGGNGASAGMPHSFSMDALSAATSRRDTSDTNSVDGDAKCSSGPIRSTSEQEVMSAASSVPNGDSSTDGGGNGHAIGNYCDEDEDVDGPALMSANIRTRIDEAKAAAANRADGLRENDNTRTAFEEILNLPQSTGPNERLLGAPVDPMPGAWFEQPSAQQQREKTVISDLLS